MLRVRLLAVVGVLVLGLAARAQDQFPQVGPDGHVGVEAGPDQFAPRQPVKPHSLWAWLTYQPVEKPGLCGCCHRCTPCCPPPLYTFFLCNGCGSCGGPVPAAAPCPTCLGK